MSDTLRDIYALDNIKNRALGHEPTAKEITFFLSCLAPSLTAFGIKSPQAFHRTDDGLVAYVYCSPNEDDTTNVAVVPTLAGNPILNLAFPNISHPSDFMTIASELRITLLHAESVKKNLYAGFDVFLKDGEVDDNPFLKEGKVLPAIDCKYEDGLAQTLKTGVYKADRTGTGTVSTFGRQMRFNLQDGFPLVTTKKVHLKGIIVELLWFLRGEGNIKFLKENNVTIWDEWARPDGSLGPVYGVQWRKWPTFVPEGKEGDKFIQSKPIDQIAEVINTIKNNPDSRRIIVSAWNVADIKGMALPPCHSFFQFYVSEGKLSCQMYQRSLDETLGGPYNLASYALLTHMIAQQCDLEVGEFVWTGGDVHIYANHIEGEEGYNTVFDQLERRVYPMPTINIKRKPESIDDYKLEDFELLNYRHHPALKFKVAV